MRELARAAERVDASSPIALNQRSGVAFGAGLGPHSESATFHLVTENMRVVAPDWCLAVDTGIAYPTAPRQKCDLRIRTLDGTALIEAKLLRLKGDNGNPNDNMLMHILSPYPMHRSALTDCSKLTASGFADNLAIMILGYSYPDLPLEPAIEAFEVLARQIVNLGERCEAPFSGLQHPVHKAGSIFAWQIQRRQAV